MRVGMGYDVHRLVEGRDLIIGGVNIPYEKGLLGHSDADVLLHAISDALLGAAALGDIGKHFPDTDPAYKGISSLLLLEKVGELLETEGFLIENIDATIIATDGFRIFKNKEKRDFIRLLAQRQGIIIITDSDSAGMVIRSHLKQICPEGTITNV